MTPVSTCSIWDSTPVLLVAVVSNELSSQQVSTINNTQWSEEYMRSDVHFILGLGWGVLEGIKNEARKYELKHHGYVRIYLLWKRKMCMFPPPFNLEKISVLMTSEDMMTSGTVNTMYIFNALRHFKTHPQKTLLSMFYIEELAYFSNILWSVPLSVEHVLYTGICLRL